MFPKRLRSAPPHHRSPLRRSRESDIDELTQSSTWTFLDKVRMWAAFLGAKTVGGAPDCMRLHDILAAPRSKLGSSLLPRRNFHNRCVDPAGVVALFASPQRTT